MLDDFLESKKTQADGVWVHIPEDEMSFKLRRTGTAEANKALVDVKRALFGIDYSEIGLTEAQRQEANVYFLASWVITDWSEVRVSEDKEPIEYTRANAITNLYNKKGLWDSLCAYLLVRSADYSLFLEKLLIEDTEQAKKP